MIGGGNPTLPVAVVLALEEERTALLFDLAMRSDGKNQLRFAGESDVRKDSKCASISSIISGTGH
jgi:hypothetical protein